MGDEMMIALIGAGSALAGALIGGAAAVMGAARAARSAYFGPLDVARREGQREAYVALLKAADTYEAETASAVEHARLLLEDSTRGSAHRPLRSGPDELAGYRSSISSAATHHPVTAAARQVGLEGPTRVAEAAKAVRATAQQLAVTLTGVERGFGHPAEGLGPVIPDQAHEQHEALRSAINAFASVAGKRLNTW
ncbi:hypothetical protein [Streptomyces sp. 058-1L]|uniref:hypothetical protein n=1 Tax=Streptomyces sp. 058-1L TaxID=2789266 RepID=UPI00397F97BF